MPNSVRAAGAVPTCEQKATGCQHRRSREDRQTSNTPSPGSATGSAGVVTEPHSGTATMPTATSLSPTETQARRSPRATVTAVGLRRDSTVDLPDGVDGGRTCLWVISQDAQARGCGFVTDGPEPPYDEVERAGPKADTVVG